MRRLKEPIKQLIREVLAEEGREVLAEEGREPEPVVNNEPLDVEIDKTFWYINSEGDVNHEVWLSTPGHKYRLSIGNCYPTEEKAEQALAHMKTHKKLQDLAFRLNDGVDIDWNTGQYKYCLKYNFNKFIVVYDWACYFKHPNNVYCLDKYFRDKAFEEICEQELADYLKWEG